MFLFLPAAYAGLLIALILASLGTPQRGGYDLTQPDAVIELPPSLKEISALTALDNTHLAAVQDEKGRLFILNAQTGTIVRETRFGKDGDYEGIEMTPEGLFVLESDGTLWHLGDPEAESMNAERIKTGLSSKYDTEGLAFDAAHNRLLIACKEFAGADLKGKKAIFAFDLATRTLTSEPAIVLDPDTFGDLDPHPLNRILRGALPSLVDASGFKPAAIAIHPQNGQIYVISSVLRSIVALSADGTLLAALPIDKKLFPQPEGMTFSPEGDLFIANEGAGGRATLLRFRPR